MLDLQGVSSCITIDQFIRQVVDKHRLLMSRNSTSYVPAGERRMCCTHPVFSRAFGTHMVGDGKYEAHRPVIYPSKPSDNNISDGFRGKDGSLSQDNQLLPGEGAGETCDGYRLVIENRPPIV